MTQRVTRSSATSTKVADEYSGMNLPSLAMIPLPSTMIVTLPLSCSGHVYFLLHIVPKLLGPQWEVLMRLRNCIVDTAAMSAC